jgi:type II secretory pathway pseudopilin PulG
MKVGRDHQQAGHSLLEFFVIVIVLGLLLLTALSRYAGTQASAERAAEKAVLESLRLSLTLKATELTLRQGAAKAHTLAQANPFDLLDGKPANYGGDVETRKILRPATWYYSTQARELLYVEQWTDDAVPKPTSRQVRHYRVAVPFGAGGVDGVIVQLERSTNR